MQFSLWPWITGLALSLRYSNVYGSLSSLCFAHLLWCPVWGVNNDPIYDNFVSYAIIMF